MYDWLELLLRWAHVIAAITWIGHALFFNWLDASLGKPDPVRPGVEGEMWMIHGGGFYLLEKRPDAPKAMLARLHWFKWEAASTWITGLLLMSVAYYMGDYLIDRSVLDLGAGAAAGIGVGSMLISYKMYDLLWLSPLRRAPGIAAAISFALLCGAAFGLTHVFSGRGAYIHVGGIMGTIMVANVWERIIPAQRNLVEAIGRGEKPDEQLAARAKQRSRHNNYMTFPVVFIMVSNHYSHTYGDQRAWLVLALVMLAGAGVRALMNRHKLKVAATVVALVSLGSAIALTRAPAEDEEEAAVVATAVKTGKPIDPATAGAIRGVVHFEGNVPAPMEISLRAECKRGESKGPVYDDAVVAEGGKLANAFVWIDQGLDGWLVPPPPAEAVTLDQSGCIYRPRVIGVRVGQELAFLNSDPILHNVHTVAEKNRPFNRSMPTAGTRISKRFTKPEVMVHAKCDVHPWMTAYIGVVDHPFFAVTGADGAFSFEGLPPGQYQVQVWHEVLGREKATATVSAKGTAEIELSLRAK